MEPKRYYTAAFVTEQGVPRKYGRNRENSSQRAIDAMGAYLRKHSPLHAELKGTFVAVGAVWGGISAMINMAKYKQGRITKKDTVLDTAGESVGMRLATGVGLLASNVVRASVLIAASSSLIPFMVGVVVTTGIKIIWDCNINRHLKCEAKKDWQQKEPAEAAVVNL